MKEILSTELGMKHILLGNEAIVRGAIEAGVGFASTYSMLILHHQFLL